ncbi:uncharacterized protein [Asterias amurensis]|uniref:uncharacterized protein n=1 Tax=Asterias amurensis TaxID=7602 RepID=UPI003AB682C1
MSYETTTFDGSSVRRATVVADMYSIKPHHDTKEDDKMAKEKKKGAIKDAVQTFADTTTAHGIPFIINGTYTLARIAWALLWLVAIGVAFVQAYSLLYEYFVIWPTTTNIELVTNTNSKFPAVTLCNMNRIRRSKVVGTRFEGLIAIDGGVSGGDYDYSWFFDWSSNWYNDWTSSSGSDSSAGTGGSSGSGTGVGSSGTGGSSEGGTGVGSSGGTGGSSEGGTGVGSSGGTGGSSEGGTGVGSSGGTGGSSEVGTGVGSSGGTGGSSEGGSSVGNNDGTDVSVGAGDASSDGTGGNTGSSVGTGAGIGESAETGASIGSNAGTGGGTDTGSSAGDEEAERGGKSSAVDPTISSTTSIAETTADGSEDTTGDVSSVGDTGTSSSSTDTPTPGSAVTDASVTSTAVTSTSVTSTVTNEAASTSAGTSTPDAVTTISYLSTAASATDRSSTGSAASGSASSADGKSNSVPDGRRRRSTDLDERKRRALRSSSSSSSSSFNLFGSSFSDFDFQYYDYYNWDDVTDENDWRGFYERSTADDFSDLVDVVNPTREELETLGHQADNFILQCTFDKKKCNFTDFRVTQNRDYGNCFTFNHGTGNDTVRYTSKSGAKYGLHLTIWIEQPEYIGILTPESGARVTVHDQRTMPIPEDEGITVAPGAATSIGVRQDYIERQPHPFGNCSNDPSQTDFAGNDYYDYSVGVCTKYCQQNALLRRCGCVTDLLIDSAAKCSYINSTQQMCRQAVDALYESNRLDCKCPTACNETSYRLGISSSRWPSERYEEHLYSRVSQTNANAARLLQNAEQTKKNVLRLRIYFEELNYQSIIQSPKYSIEGLLGALGGLFGLYVGFSVITMAEAAVFIAKLIKIILCIGPKCKSEVRPTA